MAGQMPIYEFNGKASGLPHGGRDEFAVAAYNFTSRLSFPD
jgi:hypothetical protein